MLPMENPPTAAEVISKYERLIKDLALELHCACHIIRASEPETADRCNRLVDHALATLRRYEPEQDDSRDEPGHCYYKDTY